jgi:glycerophosphoryl diester phosphodiesterase
MWNSRLTRPVFIWGHRGAPAIEPENTIRGFLVAGTAGVDGVEFDVQLSNDGVVVVMHDDMLDRTTNASGPVTIKEWAELRTVRVRHPDGTLSDERVPRLEDVLQALPTSLALCIEYEHSDTWWAPSKTKRAKFKAGLPIQQSPGSSLDDDDGYCKSTTPAAPAAVSTDGLFGDGQEFLDDDARER